MSIIQFYTCRHHCPVPKAIWEPLPSGDAIQRLSQWFIISLPVPNWLFPSLNGTCPSPGPLFSSPVSKYTPTPRGTVELLGRGILLEALSQACGGVPHICQGLRVPWWQLSLFSEYPQAAGVHLTVFLHEWGRERI